VPLELTTDYIVQAGRPVPSVSLESLPIVFAGHGITSEPWDWDDYSGVSVEGAAVVLLRGEPISETDSTLFRGRALTSFGLSSSKYEAAARRGAKAAIVIHTDATAGYPWSTAAGGLGSTQNFLASGKDVPELDLVIYLNEPAARRLLEAAGLDFDQYLKGAATRGFAAKRSSLRLDASLAAEVSPVTSHNVVARIEGDEAPDEAVIYTAHWDHVGKNDALEGDRIFNGAVDNATGTSGILELAQAFLAAGRPPRRSVLFVATTAEEKGLLGSEYMARHPIVPLEKTVAVINLDALFPFGAFSAMTVTGLGSSEIEDILEEAAAREGRVLQDDGSPEVGAYYRSDHYPFAKRGVPALFAVGNPRNEELVEGSPIKQRFDDYLANGYHKPGDEYDPETWDLAGIEEDVRILFETGYRLAQDSRFPNWHFGNEFRHLRDQMLAP
jgi:Zn-dependent M28 family amino/carboxypeptidase